jgi:hypothetical protein
MWPYPSSVKSSKSNLNMSFMDGFKIIFGNGFGSLDNCNLQLFDMIIVNVCVPKVWINLLLDRKLVQSS